MPDVTAEVALAATVADEPATAAPAESRHDGMVEEWFREHFHGSVVAQHSHIYNTVRSAVDELKRRLARA